MTSEDRIYTNYPIIYRGSYIPGGARFQPSTVLLYYHQYFNSGNQLDSDGIDGCVSYGIAALPGGVAL